MASHDDQSNQGDILSFDSWDYQLSVQGTLSTASDCSIATIPDDLVDGQGDVRVSISGAPFTLNPNTFEKLKILPWEQVNGSCEYQLHTAPHLFQIILNHAMFGSLPQLKRLNSRDIEELVPMSMVLEWKSMVTHLESKQNFFKHHLLQSGRVKDTAQRRQPPSQQSRSDTTTGVSFMKGASLSKFIGNFGLKKNNSKKLSHAEWCAASSDAIH